MLGMNLAPWTTEEQSLLEQALKTYPQTTADRWQCIADCIPTRNKKDCMRRFKVSKLNTFVKSGITCIYRMTGFYI